MHKAFEKILERLEEDCWLTTNDDGETNELSIRVVSLEDANKIVQEVAVEYDKEEEIKNGRVIFCDMHNQCDYINHWIPCSERLPSGLDFVLYTCKDGEVDICSIEYFYDYLNKFTAWQPLPSPFREIEVINHDD